MPPELPSSPSDEELAKKHLAGDPEAFAFLVERHAPALYGYCRRLTGNDEDAEDIAQETFVRLFKHLPKLRLTEPLKPWIFRVATNLCRNHAKRKKTLLFSQLQSTDYEGEDTPSLLENIPDKEPTPSDTLLRSTQAARVRSAIDALPQKYQVVLSLYYWEGLSYDDIASVLSLPLNTVRTHLNRAKAELAHSLSPHL